MYFLLENVDFHCYVSLLEGNFLDPQCRTHTAVAVSPSVALSERISHRTLGVLDDDVRGSKVNEQVLKCQVLSHSFF